MQTFRILAEIMIGATRPVVAASHRVIASSSETWKPHVGVPIQEVVSTTFDETLVSELRIPMRSQLNAWAEMLTVPPSEAAGVELNYAKLRRSKMKLPKMREAKVGSGLSSDKPITDVTRNVVGQSSLWCDKSCRMRCMATCQGPGCEQMCASRCGCNSNGLG